MVRINLSTTTATTTVAAAAFLLLSSPSPLLFGVGKGLQLVQAQPGGPPDDTPGNNGNGNGGDDTGEEGGGGGNGGIDLSVLGENSWSRFRPGWSLTVNDQCLYQFDFVFEHDETLPMGTPNFGGDCTFRDVELKDIVTADDFDGKPFLEGRSYWERFPDYVWATIGFNHLSIDWHACGHLPRGYTMPHYDFSFFRPTPEFRVHTMTCELLTEAQVVVPGDPVCAFQQDTPQGMGFWIVPGAYINRNPVVNMPESFKRPESGFGAKPHIGLRSWDQLAPPEFPQQWEDIGLYMSTYQGDLVMWQTHVPYRKISGDENSFLSKTAQYFETTISTLPDTFAYHYNATTQKVTFTLLGKAQLCRQEFEQAQAVYGGPPKFPEYPPKERPAVDANGNPIPSPNSDGSPGAPADSPRGQDGSGAAPNVAAHILGGWLAMSMSVVGLWLLG